MLFSFLDVSLLKGLKMTGLHIIMGFTLCVLDTFLQLENLKVKALKQQPLRLQG